MKVFDILKFRKERKLNQEVFSQQTGIGQSYVSRMESKKQPVTDGVLDKIAAAFNVDLEEYKSYNQQNIVSEPVGGYESAWKEKYIELLERYKDLSDKLSKCYEEKEKMRAEHELKVKFPDTNK